MNGFFNFFYLICIPDSIFSISINFLYEILSCILFIKIRNPGSLLSIVILKYLLSGLFHIVLIYSALRNHILGFSLSVANKKYLPLKPSIDDSDISPL